MFSGFVDEMYEFWPTDHLRLHRDLINLHYWSLLIYSTMPIVDYTIYRHNIYTHTRFLLESWPRCIMQHLYDEEIYIFVFTFILSLYECVNHKIELSRTILLKKNIILTWIHNFHRLYYRFHIAEFVHLLVERKTLQHSVIQLTNKQ